MTVQELLDLLAKEDPSATVRIFDQGDLTDFVPASQQADGQVMLVGEYADAG